MKKFIAGLTLLVTIAGTMACRRGVNSKDGALDLNSKRPTKGTVQDGALD